MYQLAMLIILEATYHGVREEMYIGRSRDNRETYTKARHIRVLEQRGLITLKKDHTNA